MKKVLDIFGVVKSSARRGVLGRLLLVSGFTGIDSYDSKLAIAIFLEAITLRFVPLKIHSRLKSGSEICNLRTACVRVI
jgi:hypothetical protein